MVEQRRQRHNIIESMCSDPYMLSVAVLCYLITHTASIILYLGLVHQQTGYNRQKAEPKCIQCHPVAQKFVEAEFDEHPCLVK